MKTAEVKTSSSANSFIQAKRQPFFSKEGQDGFFSKSNESTSSFFSPPTIQPKPAHPSGGLTIGQPNDKYEVEADAMADKVVQRLSQGPDQIEQIGFNGNTALQTKCDECQSSEALAEVGEQEEKIQEKEETEVRLKPIFESEVEQPEAEVQTKLRGTPTIQSKCDTCEEEEVQKKEEETSEIAEQGRNQEKPIFENNTEETLQPKSESAEVSKAVSGTDSTADITPAIHLSIQPKCDECEKEEMEEPREERELQRKEVADAPGNPSDEEENIQTKSGNARPEANADFQSRLDASKGGGSPLSSATSSTMESAFGADFSGVRVHTGSEAVQMNKELKAQAFTHGNDIYFNEGKYDIESTGGKHLLAHELTHTVQQTGMVQKADDCTVYDSGEVTHSRNAAGWLDPDVILIRPDALLIADFAIGRNRVRSTATSNLLLQTKLAEFESDCAYRFTIVGYTDCIGDESRNITLRQQRAIKVEELLGTSSRTRVSFRGMAGLGEYIAPNDTAENRAKNRSAKIEFKKGFFNSAEAFSYASLSLAKIQEGLLDLGLSTELREKNVPEYITQEGITLEPLTPKHTSDITSPSYDFFIGTVDYSNTINLSNTVRFHTYNTRKNVAIQVRDLPCVDNFLSLDQIKERIVQAITEIVHLDAAGTGAIPTYEVYRSKFHGWWEIAPYVSMSNFFDPTLDSKGPRTEKSRTIFEKIYLEDASIRSAYDLNSSGIREKIDTYMGPDALNLINSPRLQNLKETFDLYTPPVGSADYPAFKAAIQSAASNLDSNDVQAFNSSGEWQRLIIRYLSAESQRTEIINIIKTSVVVPVPPTPPTPPTPPSGGSGRAFLNHIRIDGPSAPITSINANEQVTLTPKSDRANPGLGISTKFTVTPAAKVLGTNISSVSPWVSGAERGVPFEPQITVNGTASMNAHLDLEGVPSGLAPAPTVPDLLFTVNDGRLAHLLSIWTVDFKVSTPSGTSWFSSGPTVRYQHGSQNFGISAVLNAAYPNPGLTLSVNTRVKRGSTLVASNTTPQSWPSGAWFSPPVSLTFAEPSPFPSGGDILTVEADLLDASGSVIGSKSTPVTVLAAATYTKAKALRMAREDHAHLNSNAFLNLMATQGALASRVATAIRASEADGGITLRPITIRHDSEAYVTRTMGAPDPSRVGWFLGTKYRDSAAWPSGAAAMSITPRFGFGHLGNRLIVANRSTDVANDIRRSDLSLIPLIVHEAIHALDLPDSTAHIYKYKTEFRSYWVDGRYGPPYQASCPSPPGNCKEAVFKPDITPPTPGPKSPRAREIFNHLYGNNSYYYVKPAYDDNVGGFRDMADSYLIPDGINLIASIRLERLRVLINGYSGSRFSNLRSTVRKLMGKELPPPSGGVLDAEERHEIRSTRAWRELVETKFTIASEQSAIKTDLEIPI